MKPCPQKKRLNIQCSFVLSICKVKRTLVSVKKHIHLWEPRLLSSRTTQKPILLGSTPVLVQSQQKMRLSRSGTSWSWEVACLFTAGPRVVGIVVVVCQNSLYIICISVKAKEMFYRLPKMRGTISGNSCRGISTLC